MYGEVLKFGAMIVDALREYKHPVFVYIPPGGELRGGAWVVIDPTINEKKMEMYADKDSRGGILEPPGICEVKYRAPEQKLAMGRLDPQIIDLNEALSSSPNDAATDATHKEISAREKALSPLYTQIAHEFADLHDRSGRMKAKGVITDELDWKTSRGYFYWRIRRRQGEDQIKDAMIEASGGEMSFDEACERVGRLIAGESDKEVVAWIEGHAPDVETAIKAVKLEYFEGTLKKSMNGLSASDVADILKKLS